jgi:hypothetical protein
MNKYGKGLGSGWHQESHRHALARRGIKTSSSDVDALMFREIMSAPAQVQSGYDRINYASGSDVGIMNKLQAFIHKKFTKAVDQSDVDENHPAIVNARHDIEKVNSWNKFKAWVIKHKTAIELIGLGGVIAIFAQSGYGTLMQNTTTGEIVAVGRTWWGQAGIVAETVFTGMGVMEEAKVIQHDVDAKAREESLTRPEELKTGTDVLVYKVNPQKVSLATSGDDSGEYGDLKQMSSKAIPITKLTPVERKNLKTAEHKVKNLLHQNKKDILFNTHNVQIVDRVGVDDSAWGGHQGNLIQLKRSILSNPAKLNGVLAHESIHEVYNVRDETRDLENIQIDYMGELM